MVIAPLRWVKDNNVGGGLTTGETRGPRLERRGIQRVQYPGHAQFRSHIAVHFACFADKKVYIGTGSCRTADMEGFRFERFISIRIGFHCC